MANACPSMKNAGSSREVRRYGMAYLPPYLSFLAGRLRGADGVQQKLMRHAQISTTMNVYGNALMTAKREATARWSGWH